LARKLHGYRRLQFLEADVTNDRPATARQSALTGVLMLAAGFLAMMVMNPAISASLSANSAASGSVLRGVS
jgi:hypothetical protein